jgi:rubrerythrin
MKTITTLLMTCFLLAATFNTALAEDNTRTERAPRQRSEIKFKRETRAELNHDNRRTTREISRNETEQRNQPRVDYRDSERRPDFNRRANLSNHDNQLRCTFCSGRGFTPHMNGFRHQRCNHCEGRGYRIYREMNVNVCPICFNPLHDGQLNCSLEDLAWMETNRIALVLELSDHQRNRIFEINYRYITHHYNGDYYPTSRRDREIRHILHFGQLVAFTILLNELHNENLCYNCSNGGN